MGIEPSDKKERTKYCVCGINESIGRKIASAEFEEHFDWLVYNKTENRLDIKLNVKNYNKMSEKDIKKLKEKIRVFENKKEWKNVFKVVEINNIQSVKL